MGCFSGRLMSAASYQKLFCKLCSPFCCSCDEFVEGTVISPSYSSAILTLPMPLLLNYFLQSTLRLLIPYPYTAPSHFSLPSGYHWFVTFVSLFLSCYPFVLFFRFHIWVITYNICLSLSDLFKFFSIMYFKYINVVANGKISFFFMVE